MVYSFTDLQYINQILLSIMFIIIKLVCHGPGLQFCEGFINSWDIHVFIRFAVPKTLNFYKLFQGNNHIISVLIVYLKVTIP